MPTKKPQPKKKFPTWIIILLASAILIIGIIGWGISTSNNFVKLDETVAKDAAQIQTNLQRRQDLIPNLVNTVKGYATHETEVFTQVSEARAKLAGAMSTGDISQISSANNEVSSALGRLIAISESYPDLKANTVFIGLQDELAGTENRINQARQTYNETVSNYNKAIQLFPSSIIAGMGGRTTKPYFEAAAGADQAPQVNF
jgi:LemA protein